MIFISLASGSSGNCSVIREGQTAFLIDAGISLRRIKAGLARQGMAAEDLSGVLITHEHHDHIAALPMLVKKHPDLRIYAPPAVSRALARCVPNIEDNLFSIRIGEPLRSGCMSIAAFPTPHDTPESVGYVLEGESSRFGFCTDTGHVTENMLTSLEGCGTVVIEANHDRDMLLRGRYPAALKRRILSENGHLSNTDCASFACALAKSGTHSFILGHLSRENNRPEIAVSTVREALDGEGFPEAALYAAPADGDLVLEVEPCCVFR